MPPTGTRRVTPRQKAACFDAGEQARSEAAVDRTTVGAEFARRRVRLGFAAGLEDLFEAECCATRATHMVRAGLLALVLPNLFLVSDAVVIPDVFGRSVLLHLLGTAVYGAILFYTAIRPAARYREALHAVCLTLVLAGTIALVCGSHSPNRGYLDATYVLFIVYVNVVIRLRAGWCLAFNATGTVAAFAASLLSPGLPVGVQALLPLTVLTAAVFTLYANYTIEAGERRAFLLALDQRLAAEELACANARLRALSTTDWLTGAANRRGLELYLEQAWTAAGDAARPLALLMIDVDHFKLFNDRHGHPAGDACLRQLALVIGRLLRQGTDQLGRYGGEEFAVILPDTTQPAATEIAEHIRASIENLLLPHGAAGAGPLVTVSIGARSMQPAAGGLAEALIAAADRALYEAKQRGRNCVNPPPPSMHPDLRMVANL